MKPALPGGGVALGPVRPAAPAVARHVERRGRSTRRPTRTRSARVGKQARTPAGVLAGFWRFGVFQAGPPRKT